MKAHEHLQQTDRPNETWQAGLTLIEVVIGMALAVLLCLGLISVSLKTQHFSEYSRLATEARSLAKERMEDIMAAGFDTLKNPSYSLLLPDTNTSSLGYPIVRDTHVVWHMGDGSITSAETGTYAEVHVDVSYMSPLTGRGATNTYSMIVP